MEDHRAARAVIAPLGGLLEIGAVTATGTWALPEVSIGAFLDARREELTHVLAGIHRLCGFGPVFTTVADELGYFHDHEVSAPSLLLWSGGVEDVRQDLHSPAAVRRMCRTGADLQLTELLDASVTAALVAGTDPATGARLLTGILSGVTALADGTGRCTPATAFRSWRVRCLTRVLDPRSGAPESGRAGFRAYERALDELLDP
ncbi:hypothetical protein STRCI_003311 [Streptomyces cinnabarinus]|uniref:Uncharacterized protein n=1 Tax=Streptomyces cinnabarinus TaxID=67287 RepID=A0ABY7KH87_9ACTN|nr:hypothetical protein [Streptomyces cinnabarinus]WAZ22091.1 hypothetical protein STRCI_003311 [Streptomyces cinnabarinus]